LARRAESWSCMKGGGLELPTEPAEYTEKFPEIGAGTGG